MSRNWESNGEWALPRTTRASARKEEAFMREAYGQPVIQRPQAGVMTSATDTMDKDDLKLAGIQENEDGKGDEVNELGANESLEYRERRKSRNMSSPHKESVAAPRTPLIGPPMGLFRRATPHNSTQTSFNHSSADHSTSRVSLGSRGESNPRKNQITDNSQIDRERELSSSSPLSSIADPFEDGGKSEGDFEIEDRDDSHIHRRPRASEEAKEKAALILREMGFMIPTEDVDDPFKLQLRLSDRLYQFPTLALRTTLLNHERDEQSQGTVRTIDGHRPFRQGSEGDNLVAASNLLFPNRDDYRQQQLRESISTQSLAGGYSIPSQRDGVDQVDDRAEGRDHDVDVGDDTDATAKCYYFAYADYLDPELMRKVYPQAKLIGLAKLEGYRWLLCGPPRSENQRDQSAVQAGVDDYATMSQIDDIAGENMRPHHTESELLSDVPSCHSPEGRATITPASGDFLSEGDTDSHDIRLNTRVPEPCVFGHLYTMPRDTLIRFLIYHTQEWDCEPHVLKDNVHQQIPADFFMPYIPVPTATSPSKTFSIGVQNPRGAIEEAGKQTGKVGTADMRTLDTPLYLYSTDSLFANLPLALRDLATRPLPLVYTVIADPNKYYMPSRAPPLDAAGALGEGSFRDEERRDPKVREMIRAHTRLNWTRKGLSFEDCREPTRNWSDSSKSDLDRAAQEAESGRPTDEQLRMPVHIAKAFQARGVRLPAPAVGPAEGTALTCTDDTVENCDSCASFNDAVMEDTYDPSQQEAQDHDRQLLTLSSENGLNWEKDSHDEGHGTDVVEEKQPRTEFLEKGYFGVLNRGIANAVRGRLMPQWYISETLRAWIPYTPEENERRKDPFGIGIRGTGGMSSPLKSPTKLREQDLSSPSPREEDVGEYREDEWDCRDVVDDSEKTEEEDIAENTVGNVEERGEDNDDD